MRRAVADGGAGPRRRSAACGVLAGSASALAVGAALRAGARRFDTTRLGPADRVTLVRALIGCVLAGLAVADARSPGARAGRAIPALAGVALALDAVDGIVARATGTASPFGARFDGEADAFLILVLSAHTARSFGPWALGPGLARYAFGAAGAALPWMRRPLPRRYWRKVATAGEGIALAAASASFVPRRLARAGLLAGLGLIGESFGRDVWWLWRRRKQPL